MRVRRNMTAAASATDIMLNRISPQPRSLLNMSICQTPGSVVLETMIINISIKWLSGLLIIYTMTRIYWFTGAYLCCIWVPYLFENHVDCRLLGFDAKLFWIEDKSVCSVENRGGTTTRPDLETSGNRCAKLNSIECQGLDIKDKCLFNIDCTIFFMSTVPEFRKLLPD